MVKGPLDNDTVSAVLTDFYKILNPSGKMPMDEIIDFCSNTVALPLPEMHDALASAMVSHD
jgi:hypothetical protein